MKWKVFCLVGCLLLVLVTGCSKMQPLSGKVTFRDNNEPLTQGTVIFQTDTYQARGSLDEEGNYSISSVNGLRRYVGCKFDLNYSISSVKEGDGIPKGIYSVFIEGTTVTAGKDKKGMPRKEGNLVDPKFNGTESGLKCTIDGKNKVFDFKVDRPGKSPRKGK